MKSTTSHWFACTVLVGLIPTVSRLFTWLVTVGSATELFAPQDLIAFGLVLHASIINEVRHLPAVEQSWRIALTGASMFFIPMYGVLYTLTLIGGDSVDPQSLMTGVGTFALASLLIGYCLSNRMANAQSNDPGPDRHVPT